MLSNFHAWLVAGSPAHFWLVLAGAYASACFVLAKIPKVRANTVAEVIFNSINPRVLPIVRAIPAFGPILAGFLDLWDSPAPAVSVTPAEALEAVNRARRDAGRADVSTLILIAAMLLGLAGMTLACAGCASGTDGLKQACANADQLLVSGYHVAGASARAAVASGKAPQLYGCFVDAFATLDAAKSAVDGACEFASPQPTKTLIASVAQHAADIAAAVTKFEACAQGVQ